LPIIRGQWGITPSVDQQWGGLLMWVPACLVFLAFILVTLARWYRRPEGEVPVPIPAAVAAAKQGGQF
jgi:putative membrane protein